jgi:hypothetical protein
MGQDVTELNQAIVQRDASGGRLALVRVVAAVGLLAMELDQLETAERGN